jgi:hypothetical protein
VDLSDLIIDCLQDSEYALRRCCLVSRSWVPRCRYHLFRRIDLCYGRGRRINLCNNLYAVVCQSPHIASLIQDLTIREGQFLKGEAWIKETRSLPFLLASLTNLIALKLRRVEWDDWVTGPTLRKAFRSVVASNPIVSLSFERCAFPAKSFLLIIQSCRRLKCLTIQDAHTHTIPEYSKAVEEEEATEEVFHHSVQIEDLRIERGNYRIPLESLVIGPDTDFYFRHLRTLHCDDARLYQTVLYEAGGSLCHLVINTMNLASGTPITFCRFPLGSLI